MLQRERQPGAGSQNRASVQTGALRARPDLPSVSPGVGETHSVRATLRYGQRRVLVRNYDNNKYLSAYFKDFTETVLFISNTL